MQPKNCQSVVAVNSASIVCVAETICQPNQSNGDSQSQRNWIIELLDEWIFRLDLKIKSAPAIASGRKIQFAQCVGQESFKNSENEFGGEIFSSRTTGLPNFQMHRPRKSPNASA